MTDDQLLIEEYLTGRLTHEQNQSVEARCRVDPDFTAKLKMEQQIFKVINDHEAQTFLRKTNEVVMYSRSAEKSETKKGRVVWFVAASVFLLAGIYFFSGLAKAPDSQKLYVEFFEPYPMLLNHRGPNEQGFQNLINAYDQGAWMTVEQELTKLSVTDLPAPLRDLYAAIAMMEQNKAGQAVDLLKNYLSNPADQLYQNTIEWYLALAYLKLDNRSNTKIILENLQKKVESTHLRNRIESLRKEL